MPRCQGSSPIAWSRGRSRRAARLAAPGAAAPAAGVAAVGTSLALRRAREIPGWWRRWRWRSRGARPSRAFGLAFGEDGHLYAPTMTSRRKASAPSARTRTASGGSRTLGSRPRTPISRDPSTREGGPTRLRATRLAKRRTTADGPRMPASPPNYQSIPAPRRAPSYLAHQGSGPFLVREAARRPVRVEQRQPHRLARPLLHAARPPEVVQIRRGEPRARRIGQQRYTCRSSRGREAARPLPACRPPERIASNGKVLVVGGITSSSPSLLLFLAACAACAPLIAGTTPVLSWQPGRRPGSVRSCSALGGALRRGKEWRVEHSVCGCMGGQCQDGLPVCHST